MTLIESAPGLRGLTELGPPQRAPKGRTLRTRLVLTDLLALVLAWSLAVVVSAERFSPSEAALVVGVTAALGLLVLAAHELYLARVSSVRIVEMSRISRSAIWITAAAYLASLLLGTTLTIPSVVVGGFACLILLLTGRSAFRVWLVNARSNGEYCRKIVLAGTNKEGIDLAELFLTHPECGLVVAGVVGNPRDAGAFRLIDQYEGGIDKTIEVANKLDATGVVIASSAFSANEVNVLARDLLDVGLHVQLTSAMQGIHHRRLRAQPMAYEPMFYLEQSNISKTHLGIKRAMDITVAGLMLFFTGPAILGLGLIVKLQDHGPMFFRQERVGRNETRFMMCKLRTMVVNAEALKSDLEVQNERDQGPLFKVDDDPRFTRFGKFLDASSLNELPQLWNVLKGDMSLIGPRPALPKEVESFDRDLRGRDLVRPGITGLWQVEGRDNPSFAAYKRFDLFYVENWSLSLDLMILVATVEAVAARAARLIFRSAKRSKPEPVMEPVVEPTAASGGQ